MGVTDLEREQDRLLPKESLREYAGQWVALREGKVIAADLDAVVLRDKPEVRADDLLVPVPTAGEGAFIL